MADLQAELWSRELGSGAGALGNRPQRFQAAACGDAGLVRRLQQTAELVSHAGCANTVSWGEGGALLVSAGEDCRLNLWRGTDGALLGSLESGHTSNILSACFLPGTGGGQLLSASNDRQVRLVDVAKGAVRPYALHRGRVRAVVPLDASVFLSASEDGTVRETDVRLRPAPQRSDAAARGGEGEDANVIVDQRAERVGRTRSRVGIHSLAVDPARPWLMLTGGSDPFLRLYDRRMVPSALDAHGGRAPGPQWLAHFVPSHLRAALQDPPYGGTPSGGPGGPSPFQITAVAFARGGAEVVGSYVGDCVYAFDTRDHARGAEALLSISESAVRVPRRPRAQVARRSAHHWSPLPAPPGPQQAQPPQQQQQQQQQPVSQPALARQLSRAGSQLMLGLMHSQSIQQRGGIRGISVGPSLRQLEALRRQQSLGEGRGPVVAPTVGAQSSHWQVPARQRHAPAHPTSSTLRSPPQRGGGRGGRRERGEEEGEAVEGWGPEGAAASDSEVSEEYGGDDAAGAAQVRRSRRLRRRKLPSFSDAEEEEGSGQAAGGGLGAASQQAAAVSGVAGVAAAGPSEDVGGSELEEVDEEGAGEEDVVQSPARRTRRRLAGPEAEGAPSPAAAGDQAREFREPEGRAPRRQSGGAAAGNANLDSSTLGLLGPWPASQPNASIRQRAGGLFAGRDQSPPVEAASWEGLAASMAAMHAPSAAGERPGHEASSLNSGGLIERERADSVHPRAAAVDAPSVGNQGLGGGEGREGSTAHFERDGPSLELPPQRPAGDAAAAAHQGGRHAAAPPPQQQKQQRRGPRPTASTGTSRPEHLAAAAAAAPGVRHASRLRRIAGGDVDSDSPPDPLALGESQAAAGPPATQRATSQLATQATMLSGRGPSAIGNHLPGATLGAEESDPGQGVRGGGGGGGDAGQSPVDRLDSLLRGQASAPGQPQQRQPQGAGSDGMQLRPQAPGGWGADSNVGAIIHTGELGSEEVSEPLMCRAAFGGHMNLMQPSTAGGAPPTMPIAFLGAHSEFLVSPSDCGSLFVWDFRSGLLANVLPPPGSGGGAMAATCVAAHPSAPALASAGQDGVVRLWVPEAAAPCDGWRGVATARRNSAALVARGHHLMDRGVVGAGAGAPLPDGDGGGSAGRHLRCAMM